MAMNAEEGPVVLVGIGSNLGDRMNTIERALKRLAEVLAVEKVSSIYETVPEGNPHQGRFFNAVLRGRSLDPAETLLARLLEIEVGFGRVRTEKNGPRTLDLDLLFVGDETREMPGLSLPHPRWKSRGFVIVPLLEVASDFVDPDSGERVDALVRSTGFEASVSRVAASPWPAGHAS